MSPVERALFRFLGIWVVLAGVELVERAAYRAGALDVARTVVDEDLADDDDELEPFDASDVIAGRWSPAC